MAQGVARFAGGAQEVHVLFNDNFEDYEQRNARDFLRWV